MPARHEKIVPLTILAQQLYAVLVQIEAMPSATPAEQDMQARWENAAITAFNELAGGTHHTRHQDGSVTFRSRSRPRVQHTASQDDTCTCEAFTAKLIPCWHRPALWMLDGTEEEAAAPQFVGDAEAIHCPYCAAPMYPAVTPGGRHVIECSNPRCQKVCDLEAVEHFLGLVPDGEGIALLTLTREREPAHA
jgi:hypothetical protein